ncbi:MAG: glycosyltransferase family 1 protein [Anaerolineaceae bacterium]|nr:glycosyltransferase family 1 protein [Anaerolineaceae bacterium]
MRITIFAAGSRGDIQPCIMLGKALQEAGFDLLLAAPENFDQFAADNGLRFHPLGGDVQQSMASETGRKFMESGSANPIQTIRAMRRLLEPVAMEMAQDVFEACRDADALISLAVFAPFAKTVAEVRRIPLILVEPTPMLPTRAFPSPGWPVQRNLGGLHNHLSGLAMLEVIWQWYSPSVNNFRQGLGLRPYTPGSFVQILKSTPLIGAYSPKIIPHPPDWPESVHITGYWLPDASREWQPTPELTAFLEAGGPPVYVGFGSMSGRHPEQLASVVLEAMAKSGQRGLLLTGWGGLRTEAAPDNVFVLDAAPHSWLFPRMAAVVHHGGAGTTAEGLRAGVPTVIVPFSFDQPFWGERIKAMGLGPDPIPQKNLTADRLARAITTAVTDTEMKQRAHLCGETLRAEDGLGIAVKTIKRYLAQSVAGERTQKP